MEETNNLELPSDFTVVEETEEVIIPNDFEIVSDDGGPDDEKKKQAATTNSAPVVAVETNQPSMIPTSGNLISGSGELPSQEKEEEKPAFTRVDLKNLSDKKIANRKLALTTIVDNIDMKSSRRKGIIDLDESIKISDIGSGDDKLDLFIVEYLEDKKRNNQEVTKEQLVKAALSKSFDFASDSGVIGAKDVTIGLEEMVTNKEDLEGLFDTEKLKSNKAVQRGLGQQWDQAELIGIIPRFKGEVETVTDNTEELAPEDAEFGNEFFDADGKILKKPSEEVVVSEDIRLQKGAYTSSNTRLAWRLPNGETKYTILPDDWDSPFTSTAGLREFEVTDVLKDPSDFNLELTKRLNSSPYQSKIYNPSLDSYYTTSEDGKLELDLNLSFNNAVDQLVSDIEAGNVSHEDFVDKVDDRGVSDQTTGFNYDTWAQFGFYYDPETRKVYANVHEEPLRNDKGEIINRDGVVAKSYSPWFGEDTYGLLNSRNHEDWESQDPQTYYDQMEDNKNNSQIKVKLDPGFKEFLIENKVEASRRFSASELEYQINQSTEQALEVQTRQIAIIREETKVLQNEMTGPASNLNFFEVFKKTSVNNQTLLNNQLNPLASKITQEAAVIDMLYKDYVDGKDIDIDAYNERFKKFEQDRNSYNEMVGILDLPMTEEFGWKEKIALNPYRDGTRQYLTLVHDGTGLEIVLGYNDNVNDPNNKLYSGNAREMTPNAYITQQKELADEFGGKALEEMKKMELLGFFYQDASLRINKRYEETYKRRLALDELAQSESLENATIGDYSKRTLNQFTSNYFRAMSGFMTIFVRSISQAGNLVGAYDEEDMKVFDREIKSLQQGFEAASSVAAVDEDNIFKEAFSKTFVGKAHAAMVDMIFDVLITRGVGKSFTIGRSAKQIKEAKNLFSTMMKAPTIKGGVKIAGLGGKSIVKEAMSMMTNPMFLKIANDMDKQMQDPRFASMSSSQKYLYTMMTAGVMGKLEQMGIDFATEKMGSKVVNHILEKTFSLGGNNLSRTADNVIMDYFKKGLLYTGKFSGTAGFKMTGEGLTEVAQDVFDWSAANMLNYLKGYNGAEAGNAATGFYKPDFFSKENLDQLLETFALGAIATGPVATIGTGVEIIQEYGADKLSLLADGQFSMLYSVFRDKANVDTYAIQMSAAADKEIAEAKDVKQAEVIRKKYENKIKEAKQFNETISEIDPNLSTADQREAYGLLNELGSLEKSLTNEDGSKKNPELNKPKYDRIKAIKERLTELGNKAEQNVQESVDRAEQTNLTDNSIIVIQPGQDSTSQEVTDQITIENVPQNKIDKALNNVKNGGAAILQNADGDQQIIVSADTDIETLLNHEKRHEFWREALTKNPDAGGKIVEIIRTYLKNSPGNQQISKEIDDFYREYENDPDYTPQELNEEFIMLFGDRLTDKDVANRIKDDRSVGQQLKFAFKELYRTAFNPSIKTPKNIDDVIDLLKESRRAVETGKMSKRFGMFVDQGFAEDRDIKTTGPRSRPQTKEAKANKLISQQINDAITGNTAAEIQGELYENFLAESAPPATSLLIENAIKNQLESNGVNTKMDQEGRQPNVFGKPLDQVIQDVKDKLVSNTLMRLDMDKVVMRDGKPDVGGFVISELARYRIGDVTNKLKREKGNVSIDNVTAEGQTFDAVDADADTKIMEGAETQKAKPTPRSKIKSKVPGFVDQTLEDAIETAILEIREGVRPEVDSKEFLPFIKEVIEEKLEPVVKKQLGTGKKYLDFMRMKFVPKMRETMTPQFFMQIESQTPVNERIFTKPPKRLTKQADIQKALMDDKVYVENEAQGVNLYELKDFTDQQLVDYLLPPLKIISKKTGKEVKSGLRGNRKTTVSRGAGFELGKDMIPSIFKGDPDLAIVAKKIQRDPTALMMKRKPVNFTDTDITVLGKLSRARDKNKVAEILGLSKEPINEKTRDSIFQGVLNAAKKGFLTEQVIKAGKMGSGGRQTFYGDVNNKYNDYAQAKKKGIEKVKKYFKTTTGEYVQMGDSVVRDNKLLVINQDKYKDNVNSRVDYVPVPGRLFWGNKDENYQELLKEANKNGKKPSLSKRIKVLASGITKNWFESNQAQAKRNMKELKEVALALEKAVDNGMDINVANSIMTQSYQATSGLIKISAGFQYRSRVFKYGPPGSKSQQREKAKYREEHNPPASVVGATLVWAIQNKKVSDIFPYIEKNFYQTQLSKFDDSLLDFAELDALLPEGTTILDNPIIRLAAAGINLNDIINVETNKTIIDEFGLGVDTKYYNMPNVIAMQNALVEQIVKYGLDTKKAKKLLDQYVKTPLGENQNEANNYNIAELIESGVTSVTKESKKQTLNMTTVLDKASNLDKALKNANKLDPTIKKIRVFDFDDTLATSNNKVFATRGDETIILNAEKFASDGKRLMDEGYEMDFSDFDRVTEGGRGPLFEIAKKIKEARGNEDLFVLTARSPNAQQAIYEFLKAEGLEFKRENIVGLGNSTGAAKANWIIDKAADGYNDFYFADDAFQNFKAVKDALSVIDVKSKVQQARVKEKKQLTVGFNKLLEASTGIEFFKEYSAAKAKTIGASKGRFKFFIPESAEDFTGLIYRTLGKGKIGDAQMAWYKKHLIDPYTKAQENLSASRLNLMNDFRMLKKSLKVPKDLRKKNETGMTNEQAVRVFLFESMGHEIPGLSKSDKEALLKVVANDPKLTMFAEQILTLTKGDGYSKPGANWLVGTITTDLIDLINTEKRSKYLAEWQENVDAIYTPENLNKLEALYGTKYREALEGILKRMKSGKNRLETGNRLSNRILDYINGSIGTIMFFNTRSAILQTLSSVNFVNWSFNNPLKAGAAFANQPQYWKDFMMLMNSDYLKDRRNGLRLNISESEIADAASTSKNKTKAVINYILKKGFLPTQIMDSFAIASGGATFYRNRVNDLIKNEGKTKAEAEAQAMIEWRQVAEESQQSSDPSRISAQQSGDFGRLILAFANTPMQYARIQKRAMQDLVNGRGDPKTNISKIVYYGFVQNVIFNALQQAVFALGFGDDDEDDEAFNDRKNKKSFEVANGMLDSFLRGIGIAGQSVSIGKNFLLNIYERSKRKRPEYVDSVWELTRMSPPLYSKLSRLKQAAWHFDSKKRRQKIFDKGFALDNPAYEAFAKVISATTNVPLDRLYYKMQNIKEALNAENEYWQRLAMFGGWPKWQLEAPKTNKKVEEERKAKLSPEETKKEAEDKKKQREKDKASKAVENYKAAKGSTDYDTLKKLTSSQQIKMLKGLGYGNYTIKNAKTEDEKIDLIIYKNSGNKIKVDKKAEDTYKYKKLTKDQQIKKLDSLGLSKEEIKKLKYEQDRVDKLLELMK